MIKRLLVFKVDGFCVVDSLGGCIEQKPQTSEVESPQYLNKKCVNSTYMYNIVVMARNNTGSGPC